MKTDAFKEKKIWESVDFLFIVLAISFVSFLSLKSLIIYPNGINHPGTGVQYESEFPVLIQEGVPNAVEFTDQRTTDSEADRSANVINEEKAIEVEKNAVTATGHSETVVKGKARSGSAVKELTETEAKSKDIQAAPVTDTQFDRSILENWINERDKWEQR